MRKCSFFHPRRAGCAFLTVLFLFLAFPLHGLAAPSVSAASALLMEAESGEVIYEKDADTRRPMASTTKIMTAILALEYTEPQSLVTIPQGAVGVEGSSVYLFRDEELTMEDLVYAMMLESANDAAAAIAIEVAGSVADFAVLMNEKAAELSLTSTHFENPHGLNSETHYTTARDLASLCRYALQNPDFRRVVSTQRRVIPLRGSDGSRLLLNHNRLLRSFPGAIGVKTGFTKKSGRCLVSAAERDGVTLIAVTLKAPDDWADHRAMLDYGFSLYERQTLCEPGQLSATVPVVGGTAETVTATNAEGLSRTLRRGTVLPEPVYELDRFYYAPVTEGDVLGRAVWYTESGEEIGSVALTAAAAIPVPVPKRNFFQRVWDWIRSLFQ